MAPDEEYDELPGWLRDIVASTEAFPGLAARLPIWLPTLIAAWHAGVRGMALSAALRDQLQSEEPFVWPDELTAGFVNTLGDVVDTLPTAQEAVPMAADLVTLGGEYVDDTQARELLLKALSSLEHLGQRLAQALLETAFFSPPHVDPAHRARNLRRLFVQLESLFDRGLAVWMTPQVHAPRASS